LAVPGEEGATQIVVALTDVRQIQRLAFGDELGARGGHHAMEQLQIGVLGGFGRSGYFEQMTVLTIVHGTIASGLIDCEWVILHFPLTRPGGELLKGGAAGLGGFAIASEVKSHASGRELMVFARALAGWSPRFFKATTVIGNGLEARLGDLGAFCDEVLAEETLMVLVIVKVSWGQDGGQNGHLRFDLNLHQTIDDRRGDKLVSVDTSVDDKSASNDGVVATRLSQLFGIQRNLKRSGHLELIDLAFRQLVAFELGQDSRYSLGNNDAMPG
jgi:hypothetical protein